MGPANGSGDKQSEIHSSFPCKAEYCGWLRAESSKKKGALLLIHPVLGKGTFITLSDGVYKCELTSRR